MSDDVHTSSNAVGASVLISGLPRSGKTSLANALVSAGLTHVPLDRYIRRMPTGTSFLEWVASPTCIDWPLVSAHLEALTAGDDVVAPSDWGPTWGEGGQQMREAGSGRRRVMRPSDLGYAIPGCYAFGLVTRDQPTVRVFVATPRRTIAERALARPVPEEDVESVLDEQLSSNWREIETYTEDADIVVSGLEPHEGQVRAILLALRADV